MSSATDRSGAKPGVPPIVVAILVSFGTLFETMNSTGLSVALTSLAGNLASSPEEADSVLTAYLIANAAILPLSGWASVYFGRKAFYVACVAMFTVASAMCALAWDMQSLIVFRIIQGMAAAGNAACETSLIGDTMPPEKRGLGFAIYGMAVVLGPTIGPVYGGWVAEQFNWTLIFWLNVPTGIVAVLLSIWLLRDTEAVRKSTEEKKSGGFNLDWTGFLLSAVGLASLCYVLDRGQSNDWFGSPRILWAGVVAAVCLILLPIRELSAKDPIIDFRLLANQNLGLSSILLMVTGAVLFGAPAVLPLLTQEVFNYTPTLAGQINGIGGFAVLLLLPIVGLVTGKIQTRYLVGTGFIVAALGFILSTSIYGDLTFWQLAFLSVMQSIGISTIFSPLQSHAFVGVPKDRSDQVGVFSAMSYQIGGSIGTALCITLLERGRQTYREGLVTYADPFRDEYKAAIREYGSLESFSQAIDLQASILSFNNVFFTLACVLVVSLPLIVFLKGKPS